MLHCRGEVEEGLLSKSVFLSVEQWEPSSLTRFQVASDLGWKFSSTIFCEFCVLNLLASALGLSCFQCYMGTISPLESGVKVQ